MGDTYTYRDAYERMMRSANALEKLGVEPGDRIGVLDWNTRRHFELFFAIPGTGATLLQMNLRLSPQDLGYVVNHSGAKYVLVDESLLPLAEKLAPRLDTVRGYIVMTDKPLSEIETSLSPVYHYEDLLAEAEASYDWPMIDETSAYSACYTTGTTGQPKGVYYSHRGIYLHTMTLVAYTGMNMNDCSFLLVPMFHGQGWGIFFASVMMGGKMVFPGQYASDDIQPLTDAMIREGVTVANGAPAIFLPMLRYIETLEEKPDFSGARFLSGATEPPISMMKGYKELTGAEIIHAYGATETTPIVTINHLKPTLRETLTEEEQWDLRPKQGLPVTGIDIKIIDESGNELAHDGQSAGEICVRGPWITGSYHDMPVTEDRFHEGYWRSGDAGTIDRHGYVKIVDRIKDVIKSGGEWISSIDLENAIVGHPSVAEAAVVGVPHPKWQERPVALLVANEGSDEVDPDAIRNLLGEKFAKWQIPESILLIDEIPKTSVGKIDKKVIRKEYEHLYESDG